MKSAIQAELARATEVLPKDGEKINNPEYLKRLLRGVGQLDDKVWDKLSDQAQDWYNGAADSLNVANKAQKAWEPPEFPDAENEPEPEATGRRRRRAAEESAEEPKADAKYEPKKGDKVTLTTKRGKVYVGTVVDPDDAGELVLDNGVDELGFDIDKIESIVPEKAAGSEASGRQRKTAEDSDPEPPKDPQVGYTVEIKTKRGKIILGNVEEITDADIVIRTAAGDIEEFSKDRLEYVKVKVAASGGLRRDKADDEKPAADKDAAPARKRGSATTSGEGGVKVTVRARELILEDLNASKEDIIKKLKAEGATDFKENTIQLIYLDVHKLVGLMKARKMLK